MLYAYMLILFKLNATDNTCLNINIDMVLSAILILANGDGNTC